LQTLEEREVIPRVLTQGASDSLPSITPTWLNKDGELKDIGDHTL
jgi:hypothetical protein